MQSQSAKEETLLEELRQLSAKESVSVTASDPEVVRIVEQLEALQESLAAHRAKKVAVPQRDSGTSQVGANVISGTRDVSTTLASTGPHESTHGDIRTTDPATLRGEDASGRMQRSPSVGRRRQV